MKLILKIIGALFLLFFGLGFLGVIVGDGGDANGEKSVASMTEEERQTKIAMLQVEVKKVPASDYATNLKMYDELRKLDPNNQLFQKKYTHYKDKKDAARDMERYPERFVKISNFSWSKSAYGSVMEATFTIKNTLPFAVKDIRVKCSHSAPSGTVIDSNERVIYEVIKAKKARTFREFNMGFIHSQATRSGCRITDVTRVS